jgi:DNA-binding response OmpR family regulator
MISENHTADDGSTPQHASRSILLVDDEATLRSALRRFFSRRGWTVVEAADGEFARALLLDGEVPGGGFDAIISDMRMPRVSGMELHMLVDAVDASIAQRFIFSSGDAGDTDSAAYLSRTGCPVVSKPFELTNLLALVERVAAGNHSTAA